MPRQARVSVRGREVVLPFDAVVEAAFAVAAVEVTSTSTTTTTSTTTAASTTAAKEEEQQQTPRPVAAGIVAARRGVDGPVVGILCLLSFATGGFLVGFGSWVWAEKNGKARVKAAVEGIADCIVLG